MRNAFGLIAVVILLAVGSAPAHAVLYEIVDSDSTQVTVSNGGAEFVLRFDTLRPGNDTLRAQDLLDRLNIFATNLQLRSALPLDEPTRVEDPGPVFGERFFWCDADRNPTPGDDVNGTHVCGRNTVFTNAVWQPDGTVSITRRVAQDCLQNPDFPSCL